MKKTFIVLSFILFFFSQLVFSQIRYQSKLDYKGDIIYFEKLKSDSTVDRIIKCLIKIDNSTPQQFDAEYRNSKKLHQLELDIKEFLTPRKANCFDTSIENDIRSKLLNYNEVLYIDCVNLQNCDWEISKGGTYKYYEFDAVCKNFINNYMLLNGYYKVNITNKGSKEPYLSIVYKKIITYKNKVHRFIRQ